MAATEPEPQPRTAMSCNNMEALAGATLAGLGIGCMPDFLAREALASGALRTLLDDDIDGLGNFNLTWLSNRNLSPKVRVFVDFVGARLFSAQCETPLSPKGETG